MTPMLTSHIGVRGLFLRAAEAAPSELSGNMLQHVCGMYPQQDRLAGDVDCEVDQLPLANDSLNLAFVQHGLEQNPRWPLLIEEIARCLQPEGVLMLTVFSRFSLWRSRWPRGTLLPIDRLAVVRSCESAGLTVEERLAIGPLWPLPLTDQLGSESLSFGPCHTSWALVLRKRRPGMTPIGMRRNVVFNANANARPT